MAHVFPLCTPYEGVTRGEMRRQPALPGIVSSALLQIVNERRVLEDPYSVPGVGIEPIINGFRNRCLTIRRTRNAYFVCCYFVGGTGIEPASYAVRRRRTSLVLTSRCYICLRGRHGT